MNARRIAVGISVFALAAVLGPSAQAADIVHSVVKAPIVPDGNVRGAPTDLVINLDTSLDPAVDGRTLPAGCSIRVTLPDSFVNTGLPVLDAFSVPGCPPSAANAQCSTAVFLQGWPQHPIFPGPPPPPLGPATNYSLALEGTHTVVYTALVDIVAPNFLPAPGPGIKQMHLLFSGFRNPRRPGFYRIGVEVETGPGCETTETGRGKVHILPKIRPSINFTSIFNGPGNPNAIYQQTSPGALTDLPYNFLLWNRKGGPLEGVTAQMVNPTMALLRRGKRTVGHVRIDAPPGAEGQEVFTEVPSFEIAAPISGVPTARSTVFFRAGSEAGDYVLTFRLNGGNSVQTFVAVE
jgi:hypothetical protein